jgi:putative sterol carrier protein
MSTFRDEADARHYIGHIFEIAFKTPGIGDKLAATGKTIRLKIVDPDTTIFLDLPGREVLAQPAEGAEPDVSLEMSGELANRFWQGQANLLPAIATRKIKVTGNIASLVKLQPSMEELYSVYSGLLERDNRADLLVK